jgi:hypothetical protein
MTLSSAKFQEVVEQVTASLEDRGISIPAPGIAEIVEDSARQVAGQLGMDVTQALDHADPQQIAERIAEVIHEGELAARPPRDTVPVQIAVARIPLLIAGLSETGKLAAGNGDASGASVALDPIPGLAAMLDVLIADGGPIDADQAVVDVDRGMLIDAVAVMRTASARLSAGEWSTCRCDKKHGQAMIDKMLANTMHDQADEIDQLLTVA